MRAGIDLGTTYSMIARLDVSGVPALVPDQHNASEFRTPSVVYIDESGCLVGGAAEDLLEDQPQTRVARFAKIHMATNDSFYTDSLGQAWSAEAISALMVRKLARDVLHFDNDAVRHVTIAVPAHFGDPERRATRKVGRLAGFESILIVDEPVAAATYHGTGRGPADESLLVYDLGGGTFDCTLLQKASDGLYVLATEGVCNLGGKLFDELIMEDIAGRFLGEHRFDPLDDPAGSGQLRRFAEKTKVRLSRPGVGRVRQTLLVADRAVDYSLTRSHFEELIAPHLDRSVEVSERCLRRAGLRWRDVDRVVLAGGSSLIPAVESVLRMRSQLPRERYLGRQPHQSIAFGAALLGRHSGAQAGRRAPDRAIPDVRLVAPFGIALQARSKKDGAGTLETLIPHNSPLPAMVSRVLYTTREDQSRIVISLVQVREGEEARSLGSFAFGPLRSPRKNYPIELSVCYTDEGIIRVTARDAESDESLDQVVGVDGEGAIPESEFERVAALRINE